MFSSYLLALWMLHVAHVRADGCTVIFDGRVPASTVPADFDTSSSLYNDEFVHGQNQTWADIIEFPDVNASLFDAATGTKALEITLSDESIFVPGGSTPQTGFRRSELIPNINNGTDVTVQGSTTVHWSVRSDTSRPLNLSHEYQIVFHEAADFSVNQFILMTGTPFGESLSEPESKTLRLQGRQTTDPATFFSTPFDDGVWHNFAVTVGWTSNEFTVYYSKDLEPLNIVNLTTNDNSGQGQQHFGILKLPTGDSGIDVVHEGFQESGVDEGLIYGGIFIEDSTSGCFMLALNAFKSQSILPSLYLSTQLDMRKSELHDEGFLGLEPEPIRGRQKYSWRKFVAAICFAVVIRTIASSFLSYSGRSSFSYKQASIVWTPCGDNIECGRLEVPLDYFNVSLGNASLALARYPATNKTARLGTLLTNPGGPGGSGVSYIYRAGKRISDVLEGRYDLVSWDPRGINGTTPRVECFASQTEQDIYFANTHQEILPDARNLSDPIDRATFTSGLLLADARNAILARLCHERSGETLKHVGTATVVRDLVRLYDELEGEATPINFWGFSYGTVVGSYLVNMFPDRVGKVVIDGVVNPDLWANTPAYTWGKCARDYADTEKDLQNFYSACVEAGPGRCVLATHGKTSEDIAAKVDRLLENLYERPLPVWNTTRPGPLTSSMISTMIFSYLYRPREWPDLASKLSAALNGDGVPSVSWSLSALELNSTVKPRTSSAIDAVTCIDTPPFSASDRDAPLQRLEDIVDAMAFSQQRTSRHFSALDVDMCHHWTARETERFTGPFNQTLANEMLVIGNTADPITPVMNARAVHDMMPHSTRLIVQDGSGHCSSAMTSLCTTKVIRGYFFNDELPENGVVCQTDEVLFPPKGDKTANFWTRGTADYLSEDLRMMEDMRALGVELEEYVGSFKWPRRLL